MQNLTFGLIGLGLIFLYFLPGIVAQSRHHPSQSGIAVLTLFLGWTVVGWVLALAWACSGPRGGFMKACPQCAEPVRVGAKICRYCAYRFAERPEGRREKSQDAV